MNKKIEKLIDEFSTNFSNLFIEAFTIRYLNNFDSKYYENALNKTFKLMNIKIQNKIVQKKLNNLQIKKED